MHTSDEMLDHLTTFKPSLRPFRFQVDKPKCLRIKDAIKLARRLCMTHYQNDLTNYYDWDYFEIAFNGYMRKTREKPSANVISKFMKNILKVKSTYFDRVIGLNRLRHKKGFVFTFEDCIQEGQKPLYQAKKGIHTNFVPLV